MNVYIVRHGETKLNTGGGKLQGWIDEPLNETGRMQADRLGAYFAGKGITFDKVYASPSDRAIETASRASGYSRPDIVKDERLLEMGFGPYEGKRYTTMGEETGEKFLYHPEEFVPPEGVESFQHLIERTAAFLQDLFDHETARTVMIGCHGGTIRAFLIALGKMTLEGFWMHPVHNCSWYRLTRGTDGFELAETSQDSVME